MHSSFCSVHRKMELYIYCERQCDTALILYAVFIPFRLRPQNVFSYANHHQNLQAANYRCLIWSTFYVLYFVYSTA